MKTRPNTDRQCFRFRTAKGQWLTDEIARIEALATERINAGISLPSAQTGGRVLLKGLLHDVAIDLVELSPESTRIQACAAVSEPPRCVEPEG